MLVIIIYKIDFQRATKVAKLIAVGTITKQTNKTFSVMDKACLHTVEPG